MTPPITRLFMTGIDELGIGNLSILIFAGHETTASTLAFSLGLLALYPEIQDRFLAQTMKIVAPGQYPVR
jgi:cytochrome P450